MPSDLLSPQDIQNSEAFHAMREKLQAIVSEAKSVPTPSNQVEEKGKYKYPVYEYMESLMDKYHPLRSVKVVGESYDATAIVFSFTVEITDLVTKEVRPGTGLHAAIIYDAGGETRKSDKQIRELLANAKKAALTEAIRDAMAHFGIAADMYGMLARKQPTEDQNKRFEEAIAVRSEEGKVALRKKWSTHYEDSADNFINAILEQNKQVLGKSSQTQN